MGFNSAFKGLSMVQFWVKEYNFESMVAELFLGKMETLILHVIRRNNIFNKWLYLKIKYVEFL
jgi:hypothetical protein